MVSSISMSFLEILPYLRAGSLVKRSEWRGFWVSDGQDITIITAQGDAIPLKEVDDIFFTLSMAGGGSWYKLDKLALRDCVDAGHITEKAARAYVEFLRAHGSETDADHLQNELGFITE